MWDRLACGWQEHLGLAEKQRYAEHDFEKQLLINKSLQNDFFI